MNHKSGSHKGLFPFFLGIMFFFIHLIGCTNSVEQQKWIGTWSTSPQLVEPHNMPPQPGLSSNTLRQIVRVSIGGDSLVVRFSNEFSSHPVTMKSVSIARSVGESAIDPLTLKVLTFSGETVATIAPGSALVSDPIGFSLGPRSDVAITICFGETSPDVTGHPGSRTTSYLIEGNHVESVSLEGAVKTDRWYIIRGIDVKAPNDAASIVVLGNSITDGRGSGTNKQNRWPDVLSERLLANPKTQHIGVLNQGIGGNCVLRHCLGPAAIDRFDRDVLAQQGVRWLIVLEGVNDIGQCPDSATSMQVADDLIAAYTQMIDKAHANNIKAYGATILPIGKSFYYTEFHEAARTKVNQWIRTSGRFDAVIDFDSIMRDADDSLLIRPDLHSGDFLHPNEFGYKTMGGSIDLGLFE